MSQRYLKNYLKNIWVQTAVVSLLLLVTAGGWQWWSVQQERREIAAVERAALRTPVRALETRLHSVVADLEIMASTPAMGSFRGLREYRDRFDPAVIQRVIRQHVLLGETYDQIRLIQASGQELVRVMKSPGGSIEAGPNELQDKSGRYYFHAGKTMAQGEVYVSPLDLNIENGQIELPYKPVVRLATPARREDGTLAGVLIFNVNATALLNELDLPAGEVARSYWLVNDEGYWLRGDAPEDEWGFMFPGRADLTMATRYPQAWAFMKDRRAGQLQTSQGLFTFELVEPKISLEHDTTAKRFPRWLAVSFVPQEALPAYASLRSAELFGAWLIVTVVMGVILRGAGMTPVVSWTCRRRLRKAGNGFGWPSRARVTGSGTWMLRVGRCITHRHSTSCWAWNRAP